MSNQSVSINTKTLEVPVSEMTVHQYLWLSSNKHRLDWLDREMLRMNARQERQANWILLLITTVILLAISLVLVLLVGV